MKPNMAAPTAGGQAASVMPRAWTSGTAIPWMSAKYEGRVGNTHGRPNSTDALSPPEKGPPRRLDGIRGCVSPKGSSKHPRRRGGNSPPSLPAGGAAFPSRASAPPGPPLLSSENRCPPLRRNTERRLETVTQVANLQAGLVGAPSPLCLCTL